MEKNKGTILVADDDTRVVRILREYLAAMDYEVICSYDGEQALTEFYRNQSRIDLIFLDVQMPRLDGIAVLNELRQTSLIPVVFLTAKGEEHQQARSIRWGADDYLMKPFCQTTLVQCMESLGNRLGKEKNHPLMAGGISLDQTKRVATIDGRIVDLTRREFDLFSYFVSNQGCALSREQLLDGAWGYDYSGDLRTVDTHVKQLRNKIGGYAPCLKTVFRVGYQFLTPLS